MLLFTRAIRKSASSMLSAASQLFLLIKWRSLRTLLSSDFRASTEFELRRVRVNCNEKFSEWRRIYGKSGCIYQFIYIVSACVCCICSCDYSCSEGGEQIVEKYNRQKTPEIHPGRYRQYPGGHRHHVRAVQSGRLLLLGIVSGELRYRKHTQLCAQQEVYIPASGSASADSHPSD